VGVYRRPFMPVSNGSASIVFCDVITNSSSSHSYAQQLFLSIQLRMILQLAVANQLLEASIRWIWPRRVLMHRIASPLKKSLMDSDLHPILLFFYSDIIGCAALEYRFNLSVVKKEKKLTRRGITIEEYKNGARF
jgi:hypothetical protein